MKLAVVVQRYGADISGGAELHARYIAERLARHADVEVLTTCARDYVTWKNELPPGEETGQRPDASAGFRSAGRATPTSSAGGRTVVFDAAAFGRRRADVARQRGADEPGAHRPHPSRRATTFDFFVFFSYRYYHAWHGARAVADKAVLVPTAERDPARSACRSSRRCSAARARSCTTRSRSAR